MKWFLSLFLAAFFTGCTSPSALLTVSRQTLALQGSDLTAEFAVSNEGAADSVLQWTIVSDAAELSVTPAKGRVVAGARELVTATLDRSGLVAGQQFRALLTVDSNGGRATVVVTYTMTEGGLASCGQVSSTRTPTLSDRIAPSSDRIAPSSAYLSPPVTPLPYVEGELLVKFEAGTVPESRSTVAQPRSLPELARTVAATYHLELVGSVQTERPTLLKVPAGEDVEAFARRLARDPRVAYAEPNYYLETLATPDDPRLSEQWNLLDFGVPQAWERQTGTGDVVVAVIDSGIDVQHVDLQAKILPGCDFFDKDTNPSPGPNSPEPDHGTHVAGIAVAVGNNATGVAGVAYGSGVKLLPLKVFPDAPGAGDVNALLDALLWAAGIPVEGVGTNPNPAQIINMSLGVRPSEVSSKTLEAIEDVTKRVFERGVTMFAAAGNDGDATFIRAPASSPWVYAVGSVNGDYRRSVFSDYATSGASVDFMAPGGTKLGSLCGSVLSTFADDRYGCLAGTSMASPFVAGVAALVLSQTPGLSPSDLKTRLTSSALFEAYMTTPEYGVGVVCADRALGAATRCGR